MKTAVSIPDKVFETAEKLAKQRGATRSKIYTLALENYFIQHDEAEITRKLDELYAVEDSSLDPVIKQMQARTFSKDGW